MTDADLVAVVKKLIEAENKNDATAPERLLARDFVAVTRSRGVEQDRTAMLREIELPANVAVRSLENDVWVRQCADLAVVRSIVSVHAGSPPGVARFRNIHVLRLYDGEWKCVAWQVTKLS
jgi:hypothetical protein